MQYLAKKKKPKSIHFWDGKDTFCRLYSTNHLQPERFLVTQRTLGLPICPMCEAVMKKKKYWKEWHQNRAKENANVASFKKDLIFLDKGKKEVRK